MLRVELNRGKRILLYLFFILCYLSPSAEDTVIKRFPDGKAQEIRILVNGEIVKASEYHYVTVKSIDTIGTKEYWRRYSWDKEKKLIESYWSVDDSDKLEMLFFKLCPNYTIKQHYGNGPLDYIENYKNSIRDGDYEGYDEKGKLVVKGQFSNWKKTGIWKYYGENGKVEWTIMVSGDYNEHGLSINYTIVPIIAAIFITLLLGILISKRSGYRTFYLYYCIGTIIYSITFPAIIRLIGQAAICPLFIWLIVMFILSLINLYNPKKVNVKIRTSILYAIASFVIGIFYWYLFELASIYDAVSGLIF